MQICIGCFAILSFLPLELHWNCEERVWLAKRRLHRLVRGKYFPLIPLFFA